MKYPLLVFIFAIAIANFFELSILFNAFLLSSSQFTVFCLLRFYKPFLIKALKYLIVNGLSLNLNFTRSIFKINLTDFEF